MPSFRAADGTELTFRVTGAGAPLICLPGGPMSDPDYLGDFGGLSQDVQLVLPELRGTGRSAATADPASYRCDRLSADVSALADHLGLETIRLLGHSAGANIAVQYAAGQPDRVSKLVLITPSTRAVGLYPVSEDRREMIGLRRGEPWFAEAAAAFERIQAGGGTGSDWEAITPFSYGRWDEAARAHHATDLERRHPEAAAAHTADGAFDPPATRTALARFVSPVLLLAGESDIAGPPRVLAGFAAMFPAARFVVQPAAGHFPWIDDPDAFCATVTSFLAE